MAAEATADFHKKTVKERQAILAKEAGLSAEETEKLASTGALEIETANRMIENAVGAAHLPLGIATNFLINGKERLVPMAIEEPSVVAGASYSAKLARLGGGFTASADEPIMIGQVQLVGVPEPEKAAKAILAKGKQLLELANSKDPTLVKLGGGARGVEARVLKTQSGQIVVAHLLVNVLDAMGANAVNTMAEAVAPELEKITGGKARLRIISNLADRRLARAKAVWKKEALAKEGFSGEEVVQGVIEAWEFAEADPYRCATHNKGVMNGIDAVAIATGNDWRAVEAGAHAYAARSGVYKPLTRYHKSKEGDLVGEIELPMAVATIGGSVKTNQIAQISLKILGVKGAAELAEVIAAVGLAQNFAALRALATEGIQKGHMRLHARNIAVMAGANAEEIDAVALRIAEEKAVRVDRAKEVLESLRKQKR